MSRRSALWILLAGNALTMLGVFFIAPILPLFIGARGGSPLLVGAIVSAGVTGRAVATYPAGALTDRVGRRPVIVGAMALYSLGFLLYLPTLPPEALIPVRFLHAAVGAFYGPAAAAMLADLTPRGERGSAFGMMRASDMAGMVVGPLVGGLVAGFSLSAVFVGGAIVSVIATAFLLLLPSVTPGADIDVEAPHPRRAVARRVLPMVVLGGSIGYLMGSYQTTWSLYMTHFGASPELVGLSYAIFSVPIVFLAPTAGRLADRVGPWTAATVSVLMAGLFGAIYGLVTSVPLLIALGIFEGCATVAGSPALSAMVSRAVPGSQQGQAQGLYQSGLMATQIVGAVAGGALYTVSPPYAFFGIAVAAVLSVAAAWPLRPDRAGEPALAPAP